MINVPLFLPIHCRKTTVPNSIREGLRKKYTENNTNKQNKPNKKKTPPLPPPQQKHKAP